MHLIKLKMQTFCGEFDFLSGFIYAAQAVTTAILHDDATPSLAAAALHTHPSFGHLQRQKIGRGRTTGIINITFLSHVLFSCIIIDCALHFM